MSDSDKRLGKSNHALMVVYTTNSYEEAHIIVGKLHSEDIPAVVQREAAAGALGINVGTFGAVNVLVRQADYAIAQQILFPDEPASLTDDNQRIIYQDDNHDQPDLD